MENVSCRFSESSIDLANAKGCETFSTNISKIEVFSKTIAMIGKNNFLNKVILMATAHINLCKLYSFNEFYLYISICTKNIFSL